MTNFVFDIKTKLYFGESQILSLGKIAESCGKVALLIYGGGSIRRTGIYDAIIAQLAAANVEVVEFSGVSPNPTLDQARAAIQLARKHNVDMIIAAGGGSVLDVGKAVGAGMGYDGDVWDFYVGKARPRSVKPLIGIVTLAAAGSEMSIFSVLTNTQTLTKKGMAGNDIRFDYVIADPGYTFTVDPKNTAAGVADIMSHVMEGYFSRNDCFLQNRMCEAILKTCLHFGKTVVDQPTNYEARAQILWAASMALNEIIKYGKQGVFSECHTLEHILSARYNMSHGVGLAILTPAWLRFAAAHPQTKARFEEFHNSLFPNASDPITALAEFFASLGLPSRLRDEGVPKQDLPLLADTVFSPATAHLWYVPITRDDIQRVYESCW